MVKYEVKVQSRCLVVTCYAHLKKGDLADFAETLKQLDEQIPAKDVDAFIFDFVGQTLIDHHFIRLIAPTLRLLKQHGKNLFVVSAPAPTVKVLKTNGLDGAIKIENSVDEIIARMAPPKPKLVAPHLDVNFINPFIQGTLETLRIQGLSEVKVGKPFLKERNKEILPLFDISGIIGYSLRSFGGYIALSFPEKVFLGVMSRMMGKPILSLTESLEDGAAELLNIICGHAKKNLQDKAYDFRLIDRAIPAILRGQSIEDRLSSPTAILIPFEIEGGSICLEISVTN